MSRNFYCLVSLLFPAYLGASQVVTTAMVNPTQWNAVELSREAQKRIVTAQVALKNLVRKDFFYANKPEKVILYTNTVKQLEEDLLVVTDLESRCEIAYLLGQAYFKGYKTNMHQKTHAMNKLKAFSYLNFLVGQPDAKIIRQSRAYGWLSTIYATGVKSWCGWKVPVDKDMANNYAVHAQLLLKNQ